MRSVVDFTRESTEADRSVPDCATHKTLSPDEKTLQASVKAWDIYKKTDLRRIALEGFSSSIYRSAAVTEYRNQCVKDIFPRASEFSYCCFISKDI